MRGRNKGKYKNECYRLALKMFQIWRLENFSSAVVCFWLCCSIRKFTRWLLKILYTAYYTPWKKECFSGLNVVVQNQILVFDFLGQEWSVLLVIVFVVVCICFVTWAFDLLRQEGSVIFVKSSILVFALYKDWPNTQ